ncbi:helix-turn-helix domain-containing protein [Halogranum amylolyticum]
MLCQNLYVGDTLEEAGRRVGVSQPTSSHWTRAWNNGGAKGLLTSFGG